MQFFESETGGLPYTEDERPLYTATLPPGIPRRGCEWKVLARQAWMKTFGAVEPWSEGIASGRREETKTKKSEKRKATEAPETATPAPPSKTPRMRKERNPETDAESFGDEVGRQMPDRLDRGEGDTMEDVQPSTEHSLNESATCSEAEVLRRYYDFYKPVDIIILRRMSEYLVKHQKLTRMPPISLLQKIRPFGKVYAMKEPEWVFCELYYMDWWRKHLAKGAKVEEVLPEPFKADSLRGVIYAMEYIVRGYEPYVRLAKERAKKKADSQACRIIE